MTDSIISVYGSGGYQTFLDAEAVTTTAGQLNALRQRIQISVRDVTTGASTEVGDAANRAIRVTVIGTVTTTGGGGGSTSNVTVTAWTVASPIAVSLSTATPWPVTYSQGTQVVSLSTASPWPVTVSGVAVVTFSGGTQVVSLSTATPWGVTFSQGAQLASLTTALPWPVTQSGNTWLVTQSGAPWLVSATQGTAPWVVTFSGGTQVVSLSTATPWAVTLTNPTVAFAPGQAVSVTQATTPWTVTYSAGMQSVTFTTAVVSFSGVQPVTVTTILQQAVDEQGNRVQDSDRQSLFEAMTIELRAIRLGIQYLVSHMDEAGAGSQLDLHESAKELMDSEEAH